MRKTSQSDAFLKAAPILLLALALPAACKSDHEATRSPFEEEELRTGTAGLQKGLGGANGDIDYCNNPAAPCTVTPNEGDCELDSQCTGGANPVCGADNGLRFGFDRRLDFCWEAHCESEAQDGDETGVDCGGSCGPCAVCPGMSGDSDFCTATCPCPSGQGDCDRDTQCAGGAICGVNNGARFGSPSNFDFCWPATCENRRQNTGETSVDCGGPCGDCNLACDAPIRINVNNAGAQANGATAEFGHDISADGNLIAFASLGSNLVAGDTNGTWDLFLRDVAAGTTSLLSVSTTGGVGNGGSGNEGPSNFGSGFQEVAMSDDGNFIAFVSRASNLVAGDTNSAADVFLRDVALGTTTRVSVDSAGGQAVADGTGRAAESVAISANGRYVAFGSWSPNLVAGDTNDVADTFLHDTVTGLTERVSLSESGAQANVSMRSAAITSNGRYVLFEGFASNIVAGAPGGGVFLRDRTAGTTELISRGTGAGAAAAVIAGSADMTDDARYVNFSTTSGLVAADTNGAADVYLRDRMTLTTTQMSVDSDGNQCSSPAAIASRYATISADANNLAMQSTCTFDPVLDSNSVADVYMHNRLGSVTYLLSVAESGQAGSSPSARPRISADGRFVSFESTAADLVTPDGNSSDLYRASNCAP